MSKLKWASLVTKNYSLPIQILLHIFCDSVKDYCHTLSKRHISETNRKCLNFAEKPEKTQKNQQNFQFFWYKTKLKPENQGFSKKTKVLLRKPN